MKAWFVVPLFPSFWLTLLIETTGLGSLSLIVPVAVAVPSVPTEGPESVTVKVSLLSSRRSPTIGTLTVAHWQPAAGRLAVLLEAV